MRKNKDELNMQVFCNCCGRLMKSRNGIVQEGVTQVSVSWDYFSQKDGEQHFFDLCEECYEKITEQFLLPVEVATRKELL